MAVIQAKGLTKSYKGRNVVDGISFEVGQGELFGFLGRNGAGKSTTINMLTGTARPTSGTAMMLGTPIESIDNVKKRIGILPDNSNYYGDMTALQHLKFLSDVKGIRVTPREMTETLHAVGLQGHEQKPVKKFSLGMKKKLGLAQALIGDPELIILDEPTANLDPESTAEIQKLLLSLHETGKTLFITSHNLHEMEKLCTRIAIMENGQVTKIGTLEELRRRHKHSRLLLLRIGAADETNLLDYLKAVQEAGWETEHDKDTLRIGLSREEDIPGLVALAVRHQLQVYRVEMEHVSLEQIFLE